MIVNRQTYFFSPLFLFLSVWTAIVIIHQVSPVHLYSISPGTIFISVASIISLGFGYIFYRIYYSDIPIHLFSGSENQIIEINYKKILIFVISLNIIVGISLYFYLIYLAEERGNILRYFLNPIMSRMLVVKTMKEENWNFTLALASYGTSLNIVNLVMSGILFTSKKIIYKLISLGSLILGIAISLINFSRYSLIYMILNWILSMFLFSYWLGQDRRKKILKSMLIIVLVSIILIFTAFYVIISMRYFTVTETEISKTFTEQLFYYVTGNIVALDIYLTHDHTLLHGKGVFRSITKWLSRIGLMDENAVISWKYNFVKISPQFISNVFSYIRPLYEDFGVYGLLILSFLWGFFTAKILDNYLLNFSLVKHYLSVFLSFSFLMSFYGFNLLGITEILYFVIVFKILELMTKDNLITIARIN